MRQRCLPESKPAARVSAMLGRTLTLHYVSPGLFRRLTMLEAVLEAVSQGLLDYARSSALANRSDNWSAVNCGSLGG